MQNFDGLHKDIKLVSSYDTCFNIKARLTDVCNKTKQPFVTKQLLLTIDKDWNDKIIVDYTPNIDESFC